MGYKEHNAKHKGHNLVFFVVRRVLCATFFKLTPYPILPYLLLLLAACSKGSGKDKDYDAPVLTLNTPVNNQVYTPGQNIMISGSAFDNKFINQIHIVITNQATGAEYLHVHIHPNTNSFNFTQSYTPQAGIAYKIEIIADDASTNSSAKSVQVLCN